MGLCLFLFIFFFVFWKLVYTDPLSNSQQHFSTKTKLEYKPLPNEYYRVLSSSPKRSYFMNDACWFHSSFHQLFIYTQTIIAWKFVRTTSKSRNPKYQVSIFIFHIPYTKNTSKSVINTNNTSKSVTSNKIYIKLINQLNIHNMQKYQETQQGYGERRLEGQKGQRMASPLYKS